MAQERVCEGIANLGITTLPYLTDPESAFQTVSWLNQLGHNLALEIYPFHTPSWISRISETALGNMIGLPIPKKIGPVNLRKWQVLYPDAQVTQIHTPFAYDLRVACKWVVHLGKDSPKSNIHHLDHLFLFGWAIDGNIEKIATAVNNPAVVLDIHQDVLRKAINHGQLGRFTQLAKVAVEDSTDPPCVVRELVEPFNLGFTLGLDHLDHLQTAGLSVTDVLRDEGVRRYTTAIHLAYPLACQILAEIAATPFYYPVTAYLDFHPSTLAGMGGQQELDFWLRQFAWIRSTQPQLMNRPIQVLAEQAI